MRIAAQLILSEQSDLRGAQRRPIGSPTTLRSQPHVPLDVAIRDLSSTGCFIETGERPAVGATIRVGLGGIGTIAAVVKRHEPSGFGAEFTEPLTSDQVLLAFSIATVHTGAWDAALPRAETDDVHVDKWSRPVRRVIVLGSAIALWVLILYAVL